MFEVKKNKKLIQIILELFRESNSKNKRILVKEISFFLPFRAFLRFIYTFFFRLGFLDGMNGFRYSLLISFYEYLIHLKFLEKSMITANIFILFLITYFSISGFQMIFSRKYFLFILLELTYDYCAWPHKWKYLDFEILTLINFYFLSIFFYMISY